MVDLARWLGQQLDEDERIARGADPGPWKSDSLGRHDQAAIKLAAPASLIQFDGSRAAANGMHVSRHDPARVLREIDAKRKLVKLHGRATLRAGGGARYFDTTTVCRSCEANLQFPEESWPCTTLRLLALPYADRPGYREEWAP